MTKTLILFLYLLFVFSKDTRVILDGIDVTDSSSAKTKTQPQEENISDPRADDIVLPDNVLQYYHDLSKQQKRNPPRFAIFRCDESETFWVEVVKFRAELGNDEQDIWDKFIETIKSSGAPRFGVIFYKGGVVLVSWTPSTSTEKDRNLYGKVFDRFKAALSGIEFVLQGKIERKAKPVSDEKQCDGTPREVHNITSIADCLMECIGDSKCNAYGKYQDSVDGVLVQKFGIWEGPDDAIVIAGTQIGVCFAVNAVESGLNKTEIDITLDARPKPSTVVLKKKKRVETEMSPIKACAGPRTDMPAIMSLDALKDLCIDDIACKGYGLFNRKFYVYDTQVTVDNSVDGSCYSVDDAPVPPSTIPFGAIMYNGDGKCKYGALDITYAQKIGSTLDQCKTKCHALEWCEGITFVHKGTGWCRLLGRSAAHVEAWADSLDEYGVEGYDNPKFCQSECKVNATETEEESQCFLKVNNQNVPVEMSMEVKGLNDDNKDDICKSIAETLGGNVGVCKIVGARRRLVVAVTTLNVIMVGVDADAAKSKAGTADYLSTIKDLPPGVQLLKVEYVPFDTSVWTTPKVTTAEPSDVTTGIVAGSVTTAQPADATTGIVAGNVTTAEPVDVTTGGVTAGSSDATAEPGTGSEQSVSQNLLVHESPEITVDIIGASLPQRHLFSSTLTAKLAYLAFLSAFCYACFALRAKAQDTQTTELTLPLISE